MAEVLKATGKAGLGDGSALLQHLRRTLQAGAEQILVGRRPDQFGKNAGEVESAHAHRTSKLAKAVLLVEAPLKLCARRLDALGVPAQLVAAEKISRSGFHAGCHSCEQLRSAAVQVKAAGALRSLRQRAVQIAQTVIGPQRGDIPASPGRRFTGSRKREAKADIVGVHFRVAKTVRQSGIAQQNISRLQPPTLAPQGKLERSLLDKRYKVAGDELFLRIVVGNAGRMVDAFDLNVLRCVQQMGAHHDGPPFSSA